MADQTYLFIDGEYVRQRHREAMQDFFGVEGELEISPMMQQAGATRAYFYDAIDYTRGTHESKQEWQHRVLSQEQFFSHVRSLWGFHVRPGSVRRSKKREQKEVDVLLAVDMLAQGFRGSMSKAILVAGDVDFRPAVEELVRHGVFVEVWYHPRSFAQELPDTADFGRQVRFRQLHSWNTDSFQRKHRIPNEDRMAGASTRPGQLVKMGSLFDAKWFAELYTWQHDGQSHFQLWINTGEWESIVVRDGDADLIERYVAVQYAPIKWEHRVDEMRIASQGAN